MATGWQVIGENGGGSRQLKRHQPKQKEWTWRLTAQQSEATTDEDMQSGSSQEDEESSICNGPRQR